MLAVEMLPAGHGDAILLEYGPGDTVSYRTLIDGGPPYAYAEVRERLLRIPVVDGCRHLEVLVVTHVDDDHIGGVVALLQDDALALAVGDVWFNDWQHFGGFVRGRPAVPLGPAQGEFLGVLIDDQGLTNNGAFAHRAIMVPPEPDAALPTWTTPGGLALTVVSPTFDTLLVLKRTWAKAIAAARFRPGDRASARRQFRARRWAQRPVDLGDERIPRSIDHAPANGSSIGLVAAHSGRTILLAGDAHPDVLRAGLSRWSRSTSGPGPAVLDAVKLPHHGSTKNLTPQLMDAIDCPTYLVSTNGRQFHHPNREAIDLVIAGQPDGRIPELLFSHRQPFTKRWATDSRCRARYEADARLVWHA